MATTSNLIEAVGLVGGFTLSSMMVPQVWKVCKTKSAKDLSWIFLAQYFVGLTMLIVYTILHGLWSLYVPMLFEISMLTSQIVMKYVYDRKGERSDEEKSMANADNSFKAQSEGSTEGNPMYNMS
mmetsp:Transcript_29492/g.64432  ORF Transcript_29492/g.64432 Transcript_29492/m.64432 type:complete len:125 (-) Transcript_29492:74-448(-)